VQLLLRKEETEGEEDHGLLDHGLAIDCNFALCTNILKLDAILIIEEPANPMQLNLA
jgi:hypothetical protein